MTSQSPRTLKGILSEIQKSLLQWKPASIITEQNEEKIKTKISSPPIILALYFSSAWCDDSQASHEPVATAFRATQHHHNYQDFNKQEQQPLVDLVYVSSDTSAEELEGNLEPGWHYIPFVEEELRSNVKRYFGICAKKEMETLGITTEQRKGGIPTLILIDLQSQMVLQEDAIPDVMGDTKLEDPLSHWMSLLPGQFPTGSMD